MLADSGLDFFPYSGAMPNISPPNCGLSRTGIALVAQDPKTQKLGSLSSETYFVPFISSPSGHAPKKVLHLPTGDACTGWSALPVFSRDGNSMAFVREENDRMLSISRSVFVVDLCDQSQLLPRALTLLDETGQPSQLYPDSVSWSDDGQRLFFMSAESGRYKVFAIDVQPDTSVPVQIAPVDGNAGSVLAAFACGSSVDAGSILMTESSFVSLGRFSTLRLTDKVVKEIPNHSLPDLGLSADQVFETWYESEDRRIHSFVVHPSKFDANKSYPLALMLHGGPWSAWLDMFHFRWNAAVFAEQGYVVVMPNVTGTHHPLRYSRQRLTYRNRLHRVQPRPP